MEGRCEGEWDEGGGTEVEEREVGKREIEKQREREGRVLIWARPGGSLQGKEGNDRLANQMLIRPM